MSLPSRLAKLSYAQLLDIAVDACESSPERKNKADALIAEVSPLPSWCVDVLLSPDLLPQLFSSLRLSEHAAAGVCTTWSRAYSSQLQSCHYVDPRPVRELADVPTQPNGLCMLPGGVLAITSCGYYRSVQFVAARNDSDPQALAAWRASNLAATHFDLPMGLALTNDGLLVCSLDDTPAALYKFAMDGSMDELATVPVLADYHRGFKRCAVHHQTQRTYAISQADEGCNAVVLLDANLKVVAVVEDIDDPFTEPVRDLAVHGDQVIVLTGGNHGMGSPGLLLLDLDARLLRTITAGQFINPRAVAASHGRAFVVDDYEDDFGTIDGKLLHVIDIQSGDTLQRVRVDVGGEISAILVDGDEIYIASYGNSEVIVFQFVGTGA